MFISQHLTLFPPPPSPQPHPQMSFLALFFILLPHLIISSGVNGARHPPHRNLAENPSTTSSPCPLNFTILKSIVDPSSPPKFDLPTQCQYIRQGLRLVQSEHLRLTGQFLPPPNSSESCWTAYQSVVEAYAPGFDVRSSCGFKTEWISQGCMNITTRAQFEQIVPASARNDVVLNCNQSLENSSPCAACTTSLSSLQASYLPGPSVGNVSDCTAYPSIYAAAFANIYGPTDPGTDKCLFSLNFINHDRGMSRLKLVIALVSVVGIIMSMLVFGGIYVVWLRRRKKSEKETKYRKCQENGAGKSVLEPFDGHTHLMKFTLDEIRQSTNNFSRHNIIGRGGYGNVYKGVLPDGSEVAVKRFKNCSAAGDASFAHEVEVIASVRHVNLVGLRGYCVATTKLEGHQRIIVCDLMKNGSLHDHLFGNGSSEGKEKLSWSIRQRVALGTARGLAYLHYGAQPTIIHRDIKANNILLDERFDALVADFGLAKFNPEGMSHMSTRVAGTMGYVAPEYALYGQLTERSDVYSFGVVLLELLSGKKAIVSVDDGQPSLLTDWAWSLVREGNALDVVEDCMPDIGPPEVMEKYVMVAVLCSHPQLYARPTMDQVVKILETDLPVPCIPERPMPLIATAEDIERYASSSGSGHLSSSSVGYLPFLQSGSSSSQSKEVKSMNGKRNTTAD